MGIRTYNPTTPGRRQGSVLDFTELTDRKKKPEKSLLRANPKKGGRNNQGVITSRFRGGGHKRMYRVIDFKRRKDDVWATVESIEYDPNRSARIALLKYEDGVKAYVLAPEGLKAGAAHPEEDEHIELRLVKLSELLKMIEKGAILDGKTLTSVLLYDRTKGKRRKKR